MPEDLMQGSRRTGVELDAITARIARRLYPDSTVFAKGFEDTPLPDNFFDAAIGNIPFGKLSGVRSRLSRPAGPAKAGKTTAARMRRNASARPNQHKGQTNPCCARETRGDTMKYLERVLASRGLAIFFGAGVAAFRGFTFSLSHKTIHQAAPPFVEHSITGSDLGQILRDFQKHDERMNRQQIEHQEKTDAALLQQLKAERERQRKEQERKDAEQHQKNIAAAIFGVVCGVPAFFIVYTLAFGANTAFARAIRPETVNWAYATAEVADEIRDGVGPVLLAPSC
jgi:hypothetical protein